MKAIIILNYASEEDIGEKTSIHLINKNNEWVEDVVIKPMPKKMHIGQVERLWGEEQKLCAIGYNQCIDAITGETE